MRIMKLFSNTAFLLLATDNVVQSLPFNIKPAFTGFLTGLASLRDPRGFQGFNNRISNDKQKVDKVSISPSLDQLVPDIVKSASTDLSYSLPDVCSVEEFDRDDQTELFVYIKCNGHTGLRGTIYRTSKKAYIGVLSGKTIGYVARGQGNSHSPLTNRYA
jgi:hypothetical protein